MIDEISQDPDTIAAVEDLCWKMNQVIRAINGLLNERIDEAGIDALHDKEQDQEI